jgi:hypothetical protein
MTRAVSVQHVLGKPQERHCECDRPALIADEEPSSFTGQREMVERGAKCGHRPK